MINTERSSSKNVIAEGGLGGDRKAPHYRLRNMTGLYLTRGEEILLLFREGSRVVNHLWVPSAGGHFEPPELNDPEACVLRELKEELSLSREDLVDPALRYIGLRLVDGEIRQNYYYFASLCPGSGDHLISAEGRCRWVPLTDLASYEMPLTARYVLDHYVRIGRYTQDLYTAVSDGETYQFTSLLER